MERKKKKVRKMRKCNPFLYYIVYFFLTIYYKLNHKITRKNNALKGVKGPAIVLCTHPTTLDFLHVAMMMYPHRPTIICNRFYFQIQGLGCVLRQFASIPKKLFNSDFETIKLIMKAIKSGHTVVMMPEGRLSTDGSNFVVTENTDKLIKKLGVDVYVANAEGAYFQAPKWSLSKRNGCINLTSKLILKKEQLCEMTESEIGDILSKELVYDSETVGKIKCKDRTLGLDGILYICPHCKRKYTLVAKNNKVKCSKCGYEVEMNEYCKFEKGYFDTISKWNKMQIQYVEEHLDSTNLSMAVKARRYEKDLKKIVDVGEGTMTLTPLNMRYTGEIKGEKVDRILDLETIKALPYTCRKNMTFYIDDTLHFFLPKEKQLELAEWSLTVDALTRRRMKI